MTPDFSPAMLRLFLRARVVHALKTSFPCKPAGIRNAERNRLMKAAKVTRAEYDLAWMGRLQRAEPRTRIWAALGADPAASGITLTHGGQEKAP